MRLKQLVDNGNVVIQHREIESHLNIDNRIWMLNNTANNTTSHSDNLLFNSNHERESYDKTESDDKISIITATNPTTDTIVCNNHYKKNSENSALIFHLENKETNNLDGTLQTQLADREIILGPTDASFSPTYFEEERAFEQSDTDEMSETSSHPIDPVPRGIVNPNYPGFQHLAHTLQDYSTNIENFYHSENDMTDDDVDITDITDHTYDLKSEQNGFFDPEILNNNILNKDILSSNNDTVSVPLDIPDILKTITQNNNNNVISLEYGTNNQDTDVENNFDTKDIIGNFNKEIEDEIRELLNFNINIQCDLEELRKDIKDNLAKPIETTINNISDVVNHVIMKLVVETQSDVCDHIEMNDISNDVTAPQTVTTSIDNIGASNELDSRPEMNKRNLIRPTFLLIDHDKDIVPDAFLSDGTEDINFEEDIYNLEILRDKTEKNIQKLGAELRNVIPKLDQQADSKLCSLEESHNISIVTDGNSNEIDQRIKVPSSCKRPSVLELAGKSVFNVKEHVAVNASAPLNKTKNKTFRGLDPSREVNQTKTSSRGSYKTSVPNTQNEREMDLEGFDVYNIETALPKLDFDAIENHLRAAKEAERRKHNDREEIRRRLAAGVDSEEFHSLGHGDRPNRKPSLQSRLQSGKNLQICYMNETASDNESQTSEVEKNLNPSKSLSRSSIFIKSNFNHPYQTKPLSVNIAKQEKLNTGQSGLKLRPPLISRSKSRSSQSLSHIELRESDFQALQATLQTEARIALAQAKELARVQMERERRSRAVSPVSEMLRRSMAKANAPLAADRRRVSRQLLTDINIAQLQVIVNELHGEIAALNETLVRLLMARDELHMGQDSVLVDIEDLTRYLGVKEQSTKTKGPKSGVKRLAAFAHK